MFLYWPALKLEPNNPDALAEKARIGAAPPPRRSVALEAVFRRHGCSLSLPNSG
jgi:hypothetical protein